jgi:type IV pilus assembly protein PilC
MNQKRNVQIFSKVGFLDKLLFTKHLSIMIKSGITISDAIETLASQTKSNKFNKVLTAVTKDVKNGQTLAKSLQRHPKVFDNFYISLIEVGEQSGTLEDSLNFLANQQTKEYSLHKKIQGALLYPTIVLVAITIVGMGMSLFVLPKLTDLFTSLGVKLPLTTQILLFFANLMKNHGALIIIGFFITLSWLRFFITLPFVRPKWDRIILSLPILGELLQNQQLSSICRNLGVMLKSGLPITKSLSIQTVATSNYVFKDYIKRLQKSVDKGKEMGIELDEGNYSKFSGVAVKMIAVGEKTGKLDEVFLYLGDFFEEEVDNTAKNLSVVLEPIILLGVGLLVGFVALAIISPIYELTGSIKK